MSKSMERKIKRRKEREEKFLELVRTGQGRYERYEEREKKRALPNRLNMAESVEEEIEERQTTVEKAAFV